MVHLVAEMDRWIADLKMVAFSNVYIAVGFQEVIWSKNDSPYLPNFSPAEIQMTLRMKKNQLRTNCTKGGNMSFISSNKDNISTI